MFLPAPPVINLSEKRGRNAPSLSFLEEALGGESPSSSFSEFSVRENPGADTTTAARQKRDGKKMTSDGVGEVNPNVTNILHVAVSRNDVTAIKKIMSHKKAKQLLTAQDELERVPLLLALTSSLPVTVESILKFYPKTGTDINAKDLNGNTVLHLAAMSSGGASRLSF